MTFSSNVVELVQGRRAPIAGRSGVAGTPGRGPARPRHLPRSPVRTYCHRGDLLSGGSLAISRRTVRCRRLPATRTAPMADDGRRETTCLTGVHGRSDGEESSTSLVLAKPWLAGQPS